jgi:transposase, IS5 family
VAVDTIVMEKAIAHPTDSQLYERARGQLASLAQEAGVGHCQVVFGGFQ